MRTTHGRGGLLAAVALLALVGAPSARAQVAYTANTIQSLYYKEVVKDGRVYVFNIPAEAERFEKSGEVGRAITRVGVGPNGETVVGDSETALELYFFKHGIAEPVDRPKDPPFNVVWRDGKTRFTLGNSLYMEMSNRIQPRFTYEMPDDGVTLSGTENAGDAKGSFRIRRAKFKLEGWFYKPELEFEVQLNWPDASGAQPNRFVEDANINWDVSKKKVFQVRLGQFKAPFGRQQLTSSGAQQFVDRAITDERYNDARETGVALWGVLGTNKLDWRVMMSNGNGRSNSSNDNDKFLWTGRVMWQAIGNARMNQWGSGALLSEGDLGDSANGPLLSFAAQAAKNNRWFTTSTNDPDNTTWGVDGQFKYSGFAVWGEYVQRHTKPETGEKYQDRGFLGQASYAFRTPKLGPAAYIEVAGRYAKLNPNDLVDGDDREEIGAALSYYYNRHNLKVQADYRQVKDDAKKPGEQKANEFRLQTQFIF